MTSCLCSSGFSTLSALTYAMQDCQPCATTVVCPGGGQPEFAAPGYYLTASLPSVVVPCIPQIACAGGANNTCADGYTGDLCQQCDVGYARVSVYCKPCPSLSTRAWYTSYALIVHVIVVVALFDTRVSETTSLFVLMRAMHGLFFITQYDFRWTGQPELMYTAYGQSSLAPQSKWIDTVLFRFLLQYVMPWTLFPDISEMAYSECATPAAHERFHALTAALLLLPVWLCFLLSPIVLKMVRAWVACRCLRRHWCQCA